MTSPKKKMRKMTDLQKIDKFYGSVTMIKDLYKYLVSAGYPGLAKLLTRKPKA